MSTKGVSGKAFHLMDSPGHLTDDRIGVSRLKSRLLEKVNLVNQRDVLEEIGLHKNRLLKHRRGVSVRVGVFKAGVDVRIGGEINADSGGRLRV